MYPQSRRRAFICSDSPCLQIPSAALIHAQVESRPQRRPNTPQRTSPEESPHALRPQYLPSHRQPTRPPTSRGLPRLFNLRLGVPSPRFHLLDSLLPRFASRPIAVGGAEHDPRLDDINRRRDHRRHRARRTRGDGGHDGRLQHGARRRASPAPVGMYGRAEMLEPGKLHGCEGQIAARERGVASPQLGRAVEFSQSAYGGVSVEDLVGRRRRLGVGDHLGILLQDFSGREDEARYQLPHRGGDRVSDGGREGRVAEEGLCAFIGGEEGS